MSEEEQALYGAAAGGGKTAELLIDEMHRLGLDQCLIEVIAKELRGEVEVVE